MSRRLLLFENPEDNICQMLAGFLQRSGYATELATTLAGCLEAVAARTTDVVLMITNNIHTPSAFEVAEAIRSERSNCGFVFLAGSDCDGREPFLAAGYEFRVHPIPLPIPELRDLISQAMADPAATFIIPKKKQEHPL